MEKKHSHNDHEVLFLPIMKLTSQYFHPQMLMFRLLGYSLPQGRHKEEAAAQQSKSRYLEMKVLRSQIRGSQLQQTDHKKLRIRVGLGPGLGYVILRRS